MTIQMMRLLLVLGGVGIGIADVSAAETGREQIGQVLGKPVYRDEVTRKNAGTLATQVAERFHRPVQKKYVQDHKVEFELTDEELVFYTFATDEIQVENANVALPEGGVPKRSIRTELADIEIRLVAGSLKDEERQALLKQKDGVEKRFKELLEMNRAHLRFMDQEWFCGPKLTRHLYQKYGGGRGMFTKFGIIAFDAYHRWLEERRTIGEFEIEDPQIREAVKQQHLEELASWKKQPQRGTSYVSDDPKDLELILNPPWLPTPKADSGPHPKAVP